MFCARVVVLVVRECCVSDHDGVVLVWCAYGVCCGVLVVVCACACCDRALGVLVCSCGCVVYVLCSYLQSSRADVRNEAMVTVLFAGAVTEERL